MPNCHPGKPYLEAEGVSSASAASPSQVKKLHYKVQALFFQNFQDSLAQLRAARNEDPLRKEEKCRKQLALANDRRLKSKEEQRRKDEVERQKILENREEEARL